MDGVYRADGARENEYHPGSVLFAPLSVYSLVDATCDASESEGPMRQVCGKNGDIVGPIQIGDASSESLLRYWSGSDHSFRNWPPVLLITIAELTSVVLARSTVWVM